MNARRFNFFHNEFIIPLRVSTFAFYFSFAFFVIFPFIFTRTELKRYVCAENYIPFLFAPNISPDSKRDFKRPTFIFHDYIENTYFITQGRICKKKKK